MNIWDYVSVLGGIVVIIFLLAILFEILAAFITNRKKQKLQDDLLDEAQNMFRDEISKHIAEEIEKVFEKIEK